MGQGVLVTGASLGPGRAIAKLFGKHGARVAVHYFADRDGAEAIVDYIVKRGGDAFSCRADVSSGTDVRRMFREVTQGLGKLDMVVATPCHERVPASAEPVMTGYWREAHNAALIGQYLCALAAVREFRRRRAARKWPKPTGKIMFVSPHRSTTWTGQADYASAGATEMMVRSVALDVEKYRICVNCIVPDRGQALVGIAQAALWLASDEAGLVTGETWIVDGDVSESDAGQSALATDERAHARS